MIDAPIYAPFVPTGTRPTGSERLGLGQVSMQPETLRPLNAPDEAAAQAAYQERPSATENSGAASENAGTTSSMRGDAELGMRLRIAAGGDPGQDSGPDSNSGGQAGNGALGDDRATIFDAMSRRVELAVRLALPSEEARRQFSIIV